MSTMHTLVLWSTTVAANPKRNRMLTLPAVTQKVPEKRCAAAQHDHTEDYGVREQQLPITLGTMFLFFNYILLSLQLLSLGIRDAE